MKDCKGGTFKSDSRSSNPSNSKKKNWDLRSLIPSQSCCLILSQSLIIGFIRKMIFSEILCLIVDQEFPCVAFYSSSQ